MESREPMILPLDGADTGVILMSAPVEGAGAMSRAEAERSAVECLIRGMGWSGVEHRPDGSPYIPDYDGEVSVSHSRCRAYVALHPRLRIGVDAELPREQLERVKSRFLSSRELAQWQGIGALLRAWTIKEAVFKAAGVPGMVLADIELDGGFGEPVTATVPDGRRFSLYSADAHGHTVTVALPEDR